jgi:hypothetical protein
MEVEAQCVTIHTSSTRLSVDGNVSSIEAKEKEGSSNALLTWADIKLLAQLLDIPALASRPL